MHDSGDIIKHSLIVSVEDSFKHIYNPEILKAERNPRTYASPRFLQSSKVKPKMLFEPKVFPHSYFSTH
jgi:hypothetical protein